MSVKKSKKPVTKGEAIKKMPVEQRATNFVIGEHYTNEGPNLTNRAVYKCTALGDQRALLEILPDSSYTKAPLLTHASTYWHVYVPNTKRIHVNVFENFSCWYDTKQDADNHNHGLSKRLEYRCFEFEVGTRNVKDVTDDV